MSLDKRKRVHKNRIMPRLPRPTEDDGSDETHLAAEQTNFKKRDRRILHQWDKHTEVSRLIKAVQRRPMLWDDKCPEYKIPHLKTACWADIGAELKIKGVDANGAKCKWNSIRTNFKACLSKYRARQSLGYESSFAPSTWLHFSEMMFIETGENDDVESEPTSWVGPTIHLKNTKMLFCLNLRIMIAPTHRC